MSDLAGPGESGGTMRRLLGRTALGGGALILIGAAVLLEAISYRLGTARSMGPGYFPALVAGLLVLVGLCLLVQGLRARDEPPAIPFRPTLAISAAVGFFGFVVTLLGLIPAIVGTTLLAAAAEPLRKPLRLGGLIIVLCALSWAVFVAALRLPLPLFRMPL